MARIVASPQEDTNDSEYSRNLVSAKFARSRAETPLSLTRVRLRRLLWTRK
jgi:hypothetical protein